MLLSVVNTFAGLIGLFFAFIEPTVTIVCGIIMIIHRIVQVISGENKGCFSVTAFSAIIFSFIGLSVSWFSDVSWLLGISVGLCTETFFRFVVALFLRPISTTAPNVSTPPKEHTPSNPPESVTLALDNVVLPCNLTDEERAYAKRRFCVQTNEEAEDRYYSFLESWLDRTIDKLVANFDSEILPEDGVAASFLSSPFFVSPPFPYKNKFLLCDMTIFASLTALGGIPEDVLPESGKGYIINQMETLFHEVFGIDQTLSTFMWENRTNAYNSMCETLSVDELPETCLTLMQYSYAYSRELVYTVNAGYPRVFERADEGGSEDVPLAMPLIDYYDMLELKKRYEEMVQYCRYNVRSLIEEER